LYKIETIKIIKTLVVLSGFIQITVIYTRTYVVGLLYFIVMHRPIADIGFFLFC